MSPLEAVRPPCHVLFLTAAGFKPLTSARLSHKTGEGFVEFHIPLDPNPPMGGLVNQQFGEFRQRPMNEGAQQRIVKPA